MSYISIGAQNKSFSRDHVDAAAKEEAKTFIDALASSDTSMGVGGYISGSAQDSTGKAYTISKQTCTDADKSEAKSWIDSIAEDPAKEVKVEDGAAGADKPGE